MKTFRSFLIAVTTLIGMQVSAQSVDEIVAKNIEAMGGKEKIATLKSIKMSGSMSVQGTDVTLTMTKSHMVGMRLDLEVMGTSNYQLANDKEGWVFMPVMGMTAPQAMEPDQYKSASNQMDIQGALFNYKEKGHAIELVGKEKVDGAEAYNLKVTMKNGMVVNYFIDAKTNRLIQTTGKATVNGQEMELKTSFSDYKQNGDGFWFAYSVTTQQGTIAYDKIETNVKVDDAIFKN